MSVSTLTTKLIPDLGNFAVINYVQQARIVCPDLTTFGAREEPPKYFVTGKRRAEIVQMNKSLTFW